jgi:dTDP-4-amino-4,6-dideoxygalactose transaminase
MIPQTNPLASYLARKNEIDKAIAAVLESGWYILGNEAAGFEKEFASFVGARHAIGLGSGTDALHLALKACGIGAGHAVITVSLTAVATVAAIEMAGATPVLVDIDPVSFTIDLNKLEETLKTYKEIPVKAVVPVHLYGRPADINALRDITRKYGLYLVEDCAQSHGASVEGNMTGCWGDISAFSFYPTKNLGAFGDGGAIVTSDSNLAEKVRLLREYGWQERYISKIQGINSRLDEMQAAILRVKLPYLIEDNERRRTIASIYDKELNGIDWLSLPDHGPDVHVYHQYVIRCADRDKLRAFLKEQEIGTLVHYPAPVHTQPAYFGRARVGNGGLANTEKACVEILSLSMYPQMTNDQARQVCRAIKQFTCTNHE